MSDWTGDLKDDCTLKRHGMIGRAEQMDRGSWWCAVYSDKERDDLFNTAEIGIRLKTGAEARRLVEYIIEFLHERASFGASDVL